MPIQWLTGNIFTSQAKVIVNTVNCVGVMGAGIALECRLRYPDMFEKYVQICKSGNLSPGRLWLYRGQDRWILNFPTKQDWKARSKEEYLHLGLRKFVETYEEKDIESIAFPLLGADRGGLSRDTSVDIMSQYLDDISIPVEIYSYDRRAEDDLYSDFKSWVLADGARILVQEFRIRKDIVEKLVNGLTSPKIHQINQLGQIKGIGLRTLERIFAASRSSMTASRQTELDL